MRRVLSHRWQIINNIVHGFNSIITVLKFWELSVFIGTYPCPKRERSNWWQQRERASLFVFICHANPGIELISFQSQLRELNEVSNIAVRALQADRSTSGSSIVKVVPSPCLLFTSILPPKRSIYCLTMLKPRPVPCILVPRALPARKNSSPI